MSTRSWADSTPPTSALYPRRRSGVSMVHPLTAPSCLLPERPLRPANQITILSLTGHPSSFSTCKKAFLLSSSSRVKYFGWDAFGENKWTFRLSPLAEIANLFFASNVVKDEKKFGLERQMITANKRASVPFVSRHFSLPIAILLTTLLVSPPHSISLAKSQAHGWNFLGTSLCHPCHAFGGASSLVAHGTRRNVGKWTNNLLIWP